MSTDTSPLHFPKTGLSISRAKKRAKEAVKAGAFSTLVEAQNSVSYSEMGLPWAKAIAMLNDRKNSSIPQLMTQSDIKTVMTDIPELTHFGFGAYRGYGIAFKDYLKKIENEKQSLLSAVEECNKACMYLQHLEKRKTINWVSSSYGLKHAAEHYFRKLNLAEGHYVANGSFICAAHYMGFTVKQISYDNPNACINFSMRSPIIKWRKLTKTLSLICLLDNLIIISKRRTN